ncbi:MAG TPA: 50S ribosomal protein L29 [Acidimicrobiia bacterium]
MTPTEIREMTDAELIEALGEAKTEHFNLRFQLATNQLDNNSRIREVKRDIARIHTVMRERETKTSLIAAEERA